ncbi:hypothetical protein EPI10_023347 [Gossypium australe]|uniref:Uncharacterized protein n=1 Tax=Gossypium australe TaxID=47621 RepID=A0A5B6VVA0_9ROSI|nr:hypothetical protein EPI10_023347 [Gossypium australe]
MISGLTDGNNVIPSLLTDMVGSQFYISEVLPQKPLCSNLLSKNPTPAREKNKITWNAITKCFVPRDVKEGFRINCLPSKLYRAANHMFWLLNYEFAKENWD